MRDRSPVAHLEATVEGDLVLDAVTDAGEGLRPVLVRRDDGVDQRRLDLLQIVEVDDRRFVVGQALHERRSVVVFARQDSEQRP